MTIRIATVVPRTYFGEGSESLNFDNFARYVKDASDRGADLVVFPESYPDNWQPPASLELLDKFKVLGKKYGIHIIGSILEPVHESE